MSCIVTAVRRATVLSAKEFELQKKEKDLMSKFLLEMPSAVHASNFNKNKLSLYNLELFPKFLLLLVRKNSIFILIICFSLFLSQLFQVFHFQLCDSLSLSSPAPQ